MLPPVVTAGVACFARVKFADAGATLTEVFALAQLVVVHAAPGVAAVADPAPSGSTEA